MPFDEVLDLRARNFFFKRIITGNYKVWQWLLFPILQHTTSHILESHWWNFYSYWLLTFYPGDMVAENVYLGSNPPGLQCHLYAYRGKACCTTLYQNVCTVLHQLLFRLNKYEAAVFSTDQRPVMPQYSLSKKETMDHTICWYLPLISIFASGAEIIIWICNESSSNQPGPPHHKWTAI